MAERHIPIENIYYLLCYAWDSLEQGKLVNLDKLPTTELVDLFARVLVRGVEHVARRGLDQGYAPHEEELRGIRGRVDIGWTARRFLLQHGYAACTFDELTPNTLPNQIIKSTLLALARNGHLHLDNRAAVLRVARHLRSVDEIAITGQSFRQIQLSGNNRFYRFLLNVCQLIHGAWLVDETTGATRFRDFVEDDKKLALLFQQFVYNFLRIERKDLLVMRENIHWKATSTDDPTLALLPRMHTDISVRSGNCKTVIDTKFYRDTLSDYYGSRKIHSDHLYQLMAYLSNSQEEGLALEGMLLYPLVGEPLDEKYSVLGFPIRVVTVDLSRPWQQIRDSLQHLVN